MSTHVLYLFFMFLLYIRVLNVFSFILQYVLININTRRYTHIGYLQRMYNKITKNIPSPEIYLKLL